MAARLEAGFTSAAKAVKASSARAKWKASTYTAHERGSRTIGQDDAERYAAFFSHHGATVTAIDIMFPEETRHKLSASALAELERLLKRSIEAAHEQQPALLAPDAQRQGASPAPSPGLRSPSKLTPRKHP
jgi:hypothetical protein